MEWSKWKLIDISDATKLSLKSNKFLIFVFWHFLLGYFISFDLVKPHGHWAIGSWDIAFLMVAKTIANKRNICLFVFRYSIYRLTNIGEFQLILLDPITFP